MNRLRRVLAGTAAGAVAASGLSVLGVIAAPTASAEAITVDDATFTWGINQETNSGAFAPGTWNLLSAGLVGNPGGVSTLSSADAGATWANGATAGWSSQNGNVTVEDKQADGSFAPSTFQGTRTNSAGATTSGFSSAVQAETQLVFGAGTGSVDAEAGTASIQWDGDATVLFYSGMTFFYLSDPKLEVADGTGTVTATVDGYGSDMADTSKWTELEAEEVTLATLSGFEVGSEGLTVTPDYLGVEYQASEGATDQARTGDSWGSFPQSFVDFQVQTGQSSYWYSSGGSADSRKPTFPLTVSYSEAAEPTAPTVEVSETKLLADGQHTVTVTGTGFDPALNPPPVYMPTLGSGGVYVAFGKYAQVWRPSEGAGPGTRKNGDVRWAVLAKDMQTIGGEQAGAIELSPEGTFTAELTIDKAAMDAAATDGSLVNFGIYTYRGGNATVPSFETYTPITFVSETTTSTDAASYSGAHGEATPIEATVAGGDTTPAGDVVLLDGETELASATLEEGAATLVLPGTAKVGAHALTIAYAGDDTHQESSVDVSVEIAKGTSAVSSRAASSTYGKLTPVTIEVTGGGVTPTGEVTLLDGTRELATAEVVDGAATLRLPASTGAGRRSLKVAYAGDDQYAASEASVAVTIAKKKAATTAKVAKRPTTKRVGRLVVRATKGATGKVAVVVAKGKKRVAKAQARVNRAGVATFRLPRRAAGVYRVSVVYQGDANHTAARDTVRYRIAKPKRR